MNEAKSLPFKLYESELEQIDDYAGHEIRIVRPIAFEGFNGLNEADLVSIRGGIYEVSEIFDHSEESVLRLIWLGTVE
ncbi:MAG: hypothetical protein V7L04_13995 [Nostoc sp.]|uniref:hypothetical protein n=1 Tax=Nostoc sp. TaxID=1180 RepID=UPI002FF6FA74